ncbi:NmrA family NAD(P)-binding protein [Candidatus Bathyarchaeota archaeon]|nr:NmrA family NAD(P)-binding protein [Candidatus Bathyarchaeota archaeon]
MYSYPTRESIYQLGRDGAGLQEQTQQTNIANAAAKTPTLKHYVFSTLPPAGKVSGGQLKIPHFDYKAAVDDYIKEKLPELASKTTFLWVGWYASNLTVSKPLLDVCSLHCLPRPPLHIHKPRPNPGW